ncbi:MAG TPA: Os1348 family NHLP clan protein [Herpetosiphonaceae bacterium]
MAPIDEIIQRAAADPTFAQQLRADPIGAARAAGFQISPQELAAFMGLDRKKKSDDEVVEAFQVRLDTPGTTGTKGND